MQNGSQQHQQGGPDRPALTVEMGGGQPANANGQQLAPNQVQPKGGVNHLKDYSGPMDPDIARLISSQFTLAAEASIGPERVKYEACARKYAELAQQIEQKKFKAWANKPVKIKHIMIAGGILLTIVVAGVIVLAYNRPAFMKAGPKKT